MNLTQKEQYIIDDLISQEKLCIQKYAFYEHMAYDPELKKLFANIKKQETEHLNSLKDVKEGIIADSDVNDYSAKNYRPKSDYHVKSNQDEKDHDAFLCTDSITMEKYVSSAYNFDLFQFASNKLRQLLADIEVEEQNHAEMLYKYKVANEMA